MSLLFLPLSKGRSLWSKNTEELTSFSGPILFPPSPESRDTSGVVIGASGYGFVPPGGKGPVQGRGSFPFRAFLSWTPQTWNSHGRFTFQVCRRSCLRRRSRLHSVHRRSLNLSFTYEPTELFWDFLTVPILPSFPSSEWYYLILYDRQTDRQTHIHTPHICLSASTM